MRLFFANCWFYCIFFLILVAHISFTTSKSLSLVDENTLGFGVDAATVGSESNANQMIPDNAPALTKIEVQAKVGVLLDEIPLSQRPAFISYLGTKSLAWWQARAKQQIDLTSYRLTYRTYYYNRLKYQLVLPSNDSWSFVWDATPIVETIQPNSHQLFTRQYTMSTYILSTQKSIQKSEPHLKSIGGKWTEAFTLPIDPTQLFQRTGFACLDEAQYPPNVADPERVALLFDDTCDVENEIEIGDLGCEGCHCTEPLPTKSCKAALRDAVGSIKVQFNFTRIDFNEDIAVLLRTPNAGADGADLSPSEADLKGARVIYRYFPNGSCERSPDEMCIGGYGWRRLLYFDAVDKNVGTVDVDMDTTAFVNEAVTHVPPTQEIAYGLYEYSSCHHHYHFRHFGNFAFQVPNQVPTSSKRGFCVASVDRWANAEWSPTWSDFSTCETQGITRGWSDTYQQGISCQWIDITDVPVGTNAGNLVSETNPDGLLCEGTLRKYPNGSQKYEPTQFTTLSGQPVSKQSCNRIPNWDANNQVSASVSLPNKGASYVTQSCREAHQHFGPFRNCEFDKVPNSQGKLVRQCTSGQQTNLTCTFSSSSSYQVVRVCEASQVLDTGMACRHQDALQNVLIQSGIGATVTFQCPSGKPGDPSEPGGIYSLYTAQLWGNNPASVSCT